MRQAHITCRRLNTEDDLSAVARLIYYTDDYIFPYLYREKLDVAQKVITNMIKRNTIYNYKNILVALDGERIVGIVVSQATPITIDLNEMCGCFVDAGVILDDRFAKVYNEYYKLLEDEPSGVYIANVCVDKLYRGMGIAQKMLGNVLKNATYYLETVKANEAAVRLYLNLGFEIMYEYPGFTDVPCYRMMRKQNT